VVVAGGPWTPEIVDPTGEWRPIRPVWGVVAQVKLASAPRHVLEEAEIDADIEPGVARRDVPGDDAGMSFSLTTAAGLSAVGSTFLDEEPEVEAWVSRVIERAARFVPAIATAPVDATRRCARPLSFDGRPLVGAVPGVEALFVAAGHGPWGISTGPASARLVVDAVLDGTTAIPRALDPARYRGSRARVAAT
jgi:glycine oxidase